MAVRYYIIPGMGSGNGDPADALRPKYTDKGALGAGWDVSPWYGMHYGQENWTILQANVDATSHATLAAQPDVLAVPTPLTDNLTAGAVTTIQNKLEAINLPAGWVNTSLTYQQVLGTVMRMLQFMQRYNGHNNEKFFSLNDKNSNPITLNTTFGNLTAGQKTKLQNVANSFNLDTTGITNTSTIRQIWKLVADQMFPNNSIVMGGDNF